MQLMNSVLAKFALRVGRICYLRAVGQNSDITIKFRDSDFPKEIHNLAITRRFQVFFYYADRKLAVDLFLVYLS